MISFDPSRWNTNPYHGNDTIVADWYDKKRDAISPSLLDSSDIPNYYPSMIETLQLYVYEINSNNEEKYKKALRFATQIIFETYAYIKNDAYVITNDSKIKKLLDHQIILFTVNTIAAKIIEILINSNNLSTNELTYKIGSIRNKLYNLSINHNIKDTDYNFIEEHTSIDYGDSIFRNNKSKTIQDLVLRRQYNIIKKYFPGNYPLWCLSTNWVEPIIKEIDDSITKNYSKITGDFDEPNEPMGNHHHYHLRQIINYAQKYYVTLLFKLMTKNQHNIKDVAYAYLKLNQFASKIISISKDGSLWDSERKEKTTLISYIPINHWNKTYGNTINKLTKNWNDQEPIIDLLDHNKAIILKELQYCKINPYSLDQQFRNILFNTALLNINNTYDHISKWDADKEYNLYKTLTKLSTATVDFCITELYSLI